MNSTAALYSRGSSIADGVVERSTRASCIGTFPPESRCVRGLNAVVTGAPHRLPESDNRAA